MAQLTQGGAEANPFATDPAEELPVGLQLSWRLRALIDTGRLGPGELLPSFRRLAEWSGVSVNTVRAVYARLEEEGLVVSRHGQGTFVAPGVRVDPRMEEIATDALERARDAGISPRELAVVATACAGMPESPAGDGGDGGDGAEGAVAAPGRTGGELGARRELRRQIARLEAELASYPRDLPGGPGTASPRARAHVAAVEELERTRDALIARLSEARRQAAERRVSEAGGQGTREEGPLGRAIDWWRREL